MSAAAERVSFDNLLWSSGCLALTLLPGLASRPVWISLTVGAVTALRLYWAARGHSAPPLAARLGISVLAVGLLFLQFRTFNGLSAGTALLSLIGGLKLLETRTRRDLYVLAMIVYFLGLALLLESESFWLFGYLVGVCWLTTSGLLRLTSTPVATDWRVRLRPAGRILAQALPLTVVFWLFFPRFGGPLWQMPDGADNATSGLGDTMSPGDINALALSDEVAFRVRFAANSPVPPAAERYWRGPVLHDFDGHEWSRGDPGAARPPALGFDGPAYRYTISLEPNNHNWIFVLDWPSRWDAERAVLTADSMLVQPTPIAQPLDVRAVSYGRVRWLEPLARWIQLRDTRLPAGRNPRARDLALELRRAHPADAEYVEAVLDVFRHEPFFYTLTPPRLGVNPVDDFLFETRRGFCGHYASAFASLMRAAGIPARVVTGYQGGTYNRFADYWILRQSDAHAWDEVWIAERGWTRIDPTAAIAPERVERGLNDIVRAGAPLVSRWQQRTPWLTDSRLRLDALRLLWRERILRFDQDAQERLLESLHIPEPDGQKLALVLAVCLIAGMAWLTWAVRRELDVRPRDAVERAYQRLCRRLAAVGIARAPSEGAEAYAARVATARPDLAKAVNGLCREYSRLRYAARAPGGAAQRFTAAVRSFRARG